MENQNTIEPSNETQVNMFEDVKEEKLSEEQEKELRTLGTAVKKVMEFNPAVTAITLFLGNDPDVHDAYYKTSVAYLKLAEAKEKGSEREIKAWGNKFKELKEEFFPDLDERDLASLLSLYFQFIRRYSDRAVKGQKDITELEDLVNRIHYTDGKGIEQSISFVQPINPNIRANLSKRDRIRRKFKAKGNNSPDSFTIILHNSYIVLRINKPERINLFRLIEKIETQLRHYGAKWAVPSYHLERAGIARIIVDFILDHVTYHSVKDLEDVQELKRCILANDIDTLALSILQSSAPQGVQYNMVCLANSCNAINTVLIDPYELDLLNDLDMTNEQKDIFSKLLIGEKLSEEELLKYQNKYRFNGKEVDNKILLYVKESIEDFINPEALESKTPYGEIRLKVPNLATYFTCFDYSAEIIDAEIKKLILEYPDPKLFREKRSKFLSTLRMVDYIHWIDQYVEYGASELAEGEDSIEDRSDNHREFDEGMIDAFNDDEDLYGRTMEAILTKTPYMTHTFIGLLNNTCPTCKGTPKDNNGNILSINHGFTPIDVVTNFFDHTQILLNNQSLIQSMTEEVAS